jgi:hypothetical protein
MVESNRFLISLLPLDPFLSVFFCLPLQNSPALSLRRNERFRVT